MLRTLPPAFARLVYIDPPFNTGKRQAREVGPMEPRVQGPGGHGRLVRNPTRMVDMILGVYVGLQLLGNVRHRLSRFGAG